VKQYLPVGGIGRAEAESYRRKGARPHVSSQIVLKNPAVLPKIIGFQKIGLLGKRPQKKAGIFAANVRI
jgi:hypothetical protein